MFLSQAIEGCCGGFPFGNGQQLKKAKYGIHWNSENQPPIVRHEVAIRITSGRLVQEGNQHQTS